jgi:hypothetical protein
MADPSVIITVGRFGLRRTWRSGTAVAVIGRRSLQPGPWCMPIGGGFVARRKRLMRQRGERIERSFAHL